MKSSHPWLADMKEFEISRTLGSVWQLVNSFVPYLILWTVMVVMLHRGVPYLFILLLTLPASIFLVRLFIFFHDCCHGSFFPSPRANRILGRLLGVLFFTSFDEFRYTHGRHHATVGDLDRRGTGDVWTLTAREYREAPRYKRIAYRVYREPLVMFGLGPLFTFLGVNLIPDRKLGWPRFWGVIKNDIGIAIVATTLCLTIGWKTYLFIQLPVILIAGMIGIWLFYVQHQFEPSYWARHEEWDSVEAALQGSSFYRLPKVLQWATGNIGLHHIHHLRPRIPNYNLEKCLRAIPEVQQVEPLGFFKSLRSLRLHLWDEADRRLISFRQLRKQRA